MHPGRYYYSFLLLGVFHFVLTGYSKHVAVVACERLAQRIALKQLVAHWILLERLYVGV